MSTQIPDYLHKVSFHSNPDCPEAHGLRQFRTKHNGYRCDGCKRLAQVDIKMWGCRKCNYDLCKSCYNTSAAKCDSGHHLFLTNVRSSSTAWKCSGCRTMSSASTKSYHCRICEYDLCSKCNTFKTAALNLYDDLDDDNHSHSHSRRSNQVSFEYVRMYHV